MRFLNVAHKALHGGFPPHFSSLTGSALCWVFSFELRRLLVAPGSDVNRPALLTLLSPPCPPALALTLPPTLLILLILAQTSLT